MTKHGTFIFIPPVSNFLVSPFVGWSTGPQQFVPDQTEVERIIEIELTQLLSNENRTTKTIHIAGGMKMNVPCFVINDEIIWGATAMMLNEFISVVGKIMHK
jgi:hypothetical protein